MKKFGILFLSSLLFFISCESGFDTDVANLPKPKEPILKKPHLEIFSQALSKAVENNASLRKFIKEESIKMFDNDYDVFYHLIKNSVVADGKTFRDCLKEYFDDDETLSEIENANPLLTIYIPELPSDFSAETWDASNEIPMVSTGKAVNDTISFYKDGEIVFSLCSKQIPGFPVLVVKNNERVKQSNGTTRAECDLGNGYEFIDEAFNPQVNKPTTRGFLFTNTQFPFIYDAYLEMGVSGFYWQRDNIYYGLTKNSGTSGSGAIDRSIRETMTTIAFSTDAYYKMTDQDDPRATEECRLFADNTPFPQWSEGRYEIKLDVLISNTSGLGNIITKYVSLDPSDLFSLSYTKKVSCIDLVGLYIYSYKLNNIKSKTAPLDIPLIAWDLENNGFSWKILVSEIDDQQTKTWQETTSTEFAANVQGGLKVGLNFGVSAKVTKSNMFSVVTFLNSDDLGTLECHFSDPVMTNFSPITTEPQLIGFCAPYDIYNSYVVLTIEPRKMY